MLLSLSRPLRPKSIATRRRGKGKSNGGTAVRRKAEGLKKPVGFRSSLFQSVALLRKRNFKKRPGRDNHRIVEARVKDPDMDFEEEDDPDKDPPTPFWRSMAAFMYVVPWIDIVGMGREIYHKFPVLAYLYFAASPFFGIYYSSQFAPLIIFFLMFLAIVKNKKLSHFVRFNCMQAIMLDIVVMLFTILHTYLPAEVRWSCLLPLFDMFSWVWCMSTILFCVFFTLRGIYADIPFISEAVYIQVELSEYA